MQSRMGISSELSPVHWAMRLPCRRAHHQPARPSSTTQHCSALRHVLLYCSSFGHAHGHAVQSAACCCSAHFSPYLALAPRPPFNSALRHLLPHFATQQIIAADTSLFASTLFLCSYS